MEIVYDVLVFLHFIGLGALFGGLFVQLRSEPRVVNSAVLHGVLTQVVTGLLLVGVAEGLPSKEIDYVKISVKLAVALVIAVLAFANRRKRSIPTGLYFGLMGLTVLNIGIAVFW